MKIAIPARDLRKAIVFVFGIFLLGTLLLLWGMGKALDSLMGL
jgi:hypothetical protein